MLSRRFLILITVLLLALPCSTGFSQGFPETMDDPVLEKIIELGKTDNQVMKWLDTFTNRFGGRYTGSDAYNNAAQWAVYQLREWGLQARLEEVGEVPVGFNRGPWWGKMISPFEKTLYFGTPSNTSGTKGVQRGHVVIAPEDSLQVLSLKHTFRGAWVLIPGESRGFARDGRRETVKSFLVRNLEEAGALGTIQRAEVPIKIMDGSVSSWDELPVLPDIKLQDTQYDEIKDMVRAGARVELEFDIRNWFKPGPVKYHNVVAWIPGTTYPDEYLIMSGHLDSFDGSSGAVDCGSGITPAMEAARLIMKAGGRPKRSIMVVLFAAEEMGIIGAQSWIKNNSEKIPNLGLLMNRDYNPGGIKSISVPETWMADFEKITAPLKGLNPNFPFELIMNPYPGVRSTRPGGTDASAFSMAGVPTLRFGEITDYNYSRAWHTLYDGYADVAPYREHQEHTALVLAVTAYGIANLDHQLTREKYYLADGLYADINTDKGRIIASLDYEEVPETVNSFIRMFEDPNQPRRRRGERRPPIGIFNNIDSGTAAHGILTSEAHKSRAVSRLPGERNPITSHDEKGILGMPGPASFYLTSDRKTSYNGKYTPIGKVIAGFNVISTIAEGDSIRSVTITRVGKNATEFKRQQR
ncbi:M28 family peptidase [candidate division KSB1 bacterium]